MKCEHGEDKFQCPYKVCVETRYSEPAPAVAENSPDQSETSEGQANPNEPTLTCSEVVERLRTEAYQPYGNSEFDTEKAEAILHSWRERRVQELEDGLLKYGRHLVTCPHLSENMRSNSDCNCGWDEWREQIRKGAKHE